MKAALVALVLLWTPAALAQSCRVEVIPLTIGAYDPARARVSLARGKIAVSCSQAGKLAPASSVRLHLAGPARRSLHGAGAELRYSLFQDAALQRPWWDGAPLEVKLESREDGSEVRAPVYAVLPAGQWVQPGVYQDMVLLSVEF